MIDIYDYFSIQVFFIILRETLETAIIISVLLSFIDQSSDGHDNRQNEEANTTELQVKKKMRLHVWAGAVLGLVICLVIGVIFVLCFYLIGKNYWSYAERLWEGVFSVLSSMIITVMGVGLLRINKIMKVKWWVKLGNAYMSDLNKRASSPSTVDYGTADDVLSVASRKKESSRGKYFLVTLPLITTLREGLEAVVFIGGIGLSQPLTSLPLSIFAGVAIGSSVGYALYRGGNKLSLQYFLVCSTCFLYIVSAGLMSRGVWFLELEQFVRRCGGLDVSETGSGPGSYDITHSVWHVNCCNGLTDGSWMLLNAIFGWTNSATYASVISYCVYWSMVILWLEIKLYEEREGVLPLIPAKWQLRRVKKKLALYETRILQQDLQASSFSLETQAYNDQQYNVSSEINEREAEAQVLLS